MRKFSRQNVAIVAVSGAFVLALSAAAAFAAPVLQPGVTSAPGMSGTCTNCHTYASGSSSTPKKKTTKVSHPYVSKKRHHAGVGFALWGFVSPRINTGEATLTVGVQKLAGGSWVTSSSLAATGTLSQSGKFKHKTNYVATLNLPQSGRYRLRAKLVWIDAKGTEHTKWSKLCYLRVFR
jgi:hypothetical protein